MRLNAICTNYCDLLRTRDSAITHVISSIKTTQKQPTSCYKGTKHLIKRKHLLMRRNET